jgi:hypothetical protein
VSSAPPQHTAPAQQPRPAARDGADHPRTLAAMSGPTTALDALCLHNESLSLKRRIADTTRRVLGPDHPSAPMATPNLAPTLLSMGSYAEARRLFTLTSDAQQRLLGPDHRDTLFTLDLVTQLTQHAPPIH